MNTEGFPFLFRSFAIIIATLTRMDMEKTFRRYPIGIQDFEDLRNNNCIYIDKTDLIYRISNL